MEKVETHPCFTAACSTYARIHLPVAPACNINCNYCLRRFSCANENRPGVAAKLMSPKEAAGWYAVMKKRVPILTVAGIAGPGDALANWPLVAETLRLIREMDSSIAFCLSTNGLYLPEYVDELVKLGVTYVTVTINAIRPETGAGIYAFINDHGTIYTGLAGATLLLKRQLEGIRLLALRGIKFKVNTVAVPGVNMHEIPLLAKSLAASGCILHNILSVIPVCGTKFAALAEPSVSEIEALRDECSKWLTEMRHCNRCRADAVGKLTTPDCSKVAQQKEEFSREIIVKR